MDVVARASCGKNSKMAKSEPRSHERHEPMCLSDFEELSKERMSVLTLEYYSGGADDEVTIKENIQAFKRLRLRPRMLRGITEVDMSTTILGHQVSMPICISPTALHKMAHPDGEVATAKGCAKSQTLMTHSFFSSSKMEDVVNALGQAPRLQHLYIWNDKKEFIRKLIQEEERSGVKGFVITVDEAVRGKRRSYTCTTEFVNYHLKSMNVFVPRLEEMTSKPEEYSEEKTSQTGSGLTWDIISWVKSITKLPVILKGILTAADAKLAVQHGADAIIVSNHGGRQLDGVLATIDALPEVVSAVNGQVEVYLDGGVRLGTDVLKALALGARAVFIGRPVLWGLACQGEEGVHKTLEILRTELKTAMILSGCSSLSDIPASLITKQCQCNL